MHRIQTFILRLVVDTNQPDRVRGSLQIVGEDGSYPFADGQALLVILRDWIQAQVKEPLQDLPDGDFLMNNKRR